ncbi:MAG: small ribosomal subunit Rsm22 family protein [Acidobacteriota bacterium]
MLLPRSLRQAIEQETARQSLPSLPQAAVELSRRYRERTSTGHSFITNEAHRLAYVAVRMPATFAASGGALVEAHRLAPELQIESLLDLGAGTGAASWAAAEVFDQLRQFTLIEQDRQLIELGQRLAQSSGNQALRSADWRMANLRTTAEFAPHDLVVCSYSLNEIEPAAVHRILAAAWQAARQALVIIEPGTMQGFELIRAARTQLIEAGAFIVAPCPHHDSCPMAQDDWCHFAARFDRSPLHRRLKGGTLGYEDEKFSYLAAAKQPVHQTSARIIRHPLRHAGYTQLRLCAAEGLQTISVTKRDKEAWKRARKSDWGSGWNDEPTNEPAG